jgi:hypothetical protein
MALASVRQPCPVTCQQLLHILLNFRSIMQLFNFFRCVMNHVNQSVAYPSAQRISAAEIPLFCAVILKTETLLEQNF